MLRDYLLYLMGGSHFKLLYEYPIFPKCLEIIDLEYFLPYYLYI